MSTSVISCMIVTYVLETGVVAVVVVIVHLVVGIFRSFHAHKPEPRGGWVLPL